MLVRTIDFETTGIPTETEKHAVCEVGWCDVMDLPTRDPGEIVQWACTAPRAALVDPGRGMPVEAMAVHHIKDRDLVGAPPATSVFRVIGDGADAFAAHNAKFEREFFTGGDRPWICTYKCALRAWPDSPSHGNQVLRYALGLDREMDESLAMPPHRAGPDAYVTAHILARLLAAHPVADLIRWSSEPAVLITCHFPKYRGMKWADVPSDYLDWMLRQKDMGEDLHHTARHHLRLRQREQA